MMNLTSGNSTQELISSTIQVKGLHHTTFGLLCDLHRIVLTVNTVYQGLQLKVTSPCDSRLRQQIC